jgi:hypothetical protein
VPFSAAGENSSATDIGRRAARSDKCAPKPARAHRELRSVTRRISTAMLLRITFDIGFSPAGFRLEAQRLSIPGVEDHITSERTTSEPGRAHPARGRFCRSLAAAGSPVRMKLLGEWRGVGHGCVAPVKPRTKPTTNRWRRAWREGGRSEGRRAPTRAPGAEPEPACLRNRKPTDGSIP